MFHFSYIVCESQVKVDKHYTNTQLQQRDAHTHTHQTHTKQRVPPKPTRHTFATFVTLLSVHLCDANLICVWSMCCMFCAYVLPSVSSMCNVFPSIHINHTSTTHINNTSLLGVYMTVHGANSMGDQSMHLGCVFLLFFSVFMVMFLFNRSVRSEIKGYCRLMCVVVASQIMVRMASLSFFHCLFFY